MRNGLVVLVAAGLLAGCMQGPQTSGEVRNFVDRVGMFSKKSVISVPRSHGAVTASLRAGAKKCMNRTETVSGWGPGPAPGSRVYTSTTTAYRGTVSTSGGKTELQLYREVLGRGFLPQPKGVAYVVDAVPASGGTQLAFYGGRIGYGDINKAVESWARTGQIQCPDLP